MEVYEEFSQIDTCSLYLTEISSANNLKAVKSHGGKSSVSCPLKPSDSAPLKHSTMPP